MKLTEFVYRNRYPIAITTLTFISTFLSVLEAQASSPTWHMTSYFGEVDSVHHKPHNGMDFAMPIGTLVNSIVEGDVVKVLHDGDKSWGNSVHIKDDHDRVVIYGHLHDTTVQVGDHVHVGDLIAHSGNSGRSTGPHLHIQVNINGKPIDPTIDIVHAVLSGRIGK